jgi:GxxExxY protein
MLKPSDGLAFDEEAFPLQAVTGTVIAAAHSVFRSLGYGFLESVYRRALVVELRHRGVRVEQEVVYELFHLDELIGAYKADVIVDSRVIVEVKTGLALDPTAPVQLLNYLCAARLSVGIVMYFGPKGAKAKRVIASDFVRSVDRRT